MIYGLSLLLMILGLVVAIPALRKLFRMQTIRKQSQIIVGKVESIDNSINIQRSFMGMFVADEITNHQRPLIRYQPAEGQEMSVEIVPSTFLSGRRYESGESVEIVYDLSEPWRAYPIREWAATARDLWMGIAISLISVILWVVGRVYNLPF